MMLSNRYQKGGTKSENPGYYWVFRLSVIIPTRCSITKLNDFCLGTMIPVILFVSIIPISSAIRWMFI